MKMLRLRLHIIANILTGVIKLFSATTARLKLMTCHITCAHANEMHYTSIIMLAFVFPLPIWFDGEVPTLENIFITS